MKKKYVTFHLKNESLSPFKKSGANTKKFHRTLYYLKRTVLFFPLSFFLIFVVCEKSAD